MDPGPESEFKMIGLYNVSFPYNMCGAELVTQDSVCMCVYFIILHDLPQLYGQVGLACLSMVLILFLCDQPGFKGV
jgi:hypothetical protein